MGLVDYLGAAGRFLARPLKCLAPVVKYGAPVVALTTVPATANAQSSIADEDERSDMSARVRLSCAFSDYRNAQFSALGRLGIHPSGLLDGRGQVTLHAQGGIGSFESSTGAPDLNSDWWRAGAGLGYHFIDNEKDHFYAELLALYDGAALNDQVDLDREGVLAGIMANGSSEDAGIQFWLNFLYGKSEYDGSYRSGQPFPEELGEYSRAYLNAAISGVVGGDLSEDDWLVRIRASATYELTDYVDLARTETITSRQSIDFRNWLGDRFGDEPHEFAIQPYIQEKWINGDFAFQFGLDLVYKPIDELQFRFGVGYDERENVLASFSVDLIPQTRNRGERARLREED